MIGTVAGRLVAAVVMGLTAQGQACLRDDVPLVRMVGVGLLELAARICLVVAEGA